MRTEFESGKRTPIQQVIEYNVTNGQNYLEEPPHTVAADGFEETGNLEDMLEDLEIRKDCQPAFALTIRQKLSPEVREHQRVLSKLSGVPMPERPSIPRCRIVPSSPALKVL